jgi:NTP pyrophosphatase (non-canonical NTP hydrolase)
MNLELNTNNSPESLVTQHAVAHLQKICHEASANAGWWTNKDGTFVLDNPLAVSNKLCLIHGEISEAMEADRKDKMDDHLPHRKGIEGELSDAIIRIFDLAGALKLDIAGTLVEKMEYNAKRVDHKKEAREAVGGKKY